MAYTVYCSYSGRDILYGSVFEKQTAKANQARILIELNKDQDAESLLKTITLPELSKDKETLLHIINKAKSSDKK